MQACTTVVSLGPAGGEPEPEAAAAATGERAHQGGFIGSLALSLAYIHI